jgi:hypothetical protein
MSKKPSFMASMMGWKVDPLNNDPYNSNINHKAPNADYQNVIYPNVPYNNDSDKLEFKNDILEWTNDDENHIENQEGSLCGKHAINHILQEEKIVLRNDINSQFINKTTNLQAPDDSNPKLPNIQLNLFKYCGIIEHMTAWSLGMSPYTYRTTDIDPNTGENQYMPTCDKNYQNLTFLGVEHLLRILGYETISNHLDKTSNDKKDEFWTNFSVQLEDSNLLGVIINLGGNHYTAISTYLKNCDTWQLIDHDIKSAKFSYIDSIGAEVHCFTMLELIQHLIIRDIEAVIYVYDKAGAYASVAARRHRRIYPVAGGRHSRRRHNKHRHTKHRHNKRCRTKHHRRVSKRTRKSRK